MNSSQSLLYSKASVARLLKVSGSKIVSLQVWHKVCFVILAGERATFVSLAGLRQAFVDFRKKLDLTLTFKRKAQVGLSYVKGSVYSESSGKWYSVELSSQTGVKCDCEDFNKQVAAFGKGVCKHGYKVLRYVGCESLSQYFSNFS
jgi:hypothetical protein